jgi:hypothetical protein
VRGRHAALLGGAVVAALAGVSAAGSPRIAAAATQPGAVASEATRVAPPAADPPALAILLKPAYTNGEPDGLDVVERITGIPADPSTPLLELARVVYNVPTVANELGTLQAADEQGALTLTPRDVGAGPAVRRQWFPDRATRGTVTVSYRAPGATSASRGAAPPIELKVESRAVSAGAAAVLLRPVVPRVAMTLAWNLDAPGVDSFAGREIVDAPSRLDRVFVMAGRTNVYPASRSSRGFQAVWQGTPAFDAPALMRWTEQLHASMTEFFRAADAPYTVFMRGNPVNAGGGIGMDRSFVVTFGAGSGSDQAKLRMTLSHEMFHTFQPHLSAPDGQELLASSWFNEGTAVFYQRVLPLRAGLIDADAFLADLNYYAARYYTSALGNTPNDQIPARFWEDTRIRTLPYDRGFLYFVTVDDAVRKASGGRRSLDDLILALKAREDTGQPVTPTTWEALLRAELGEPGVAEFRRVLAGGTPLPASDAFGRCFRRVSKPLQRFELGFAPKVLTESPRIVRDLVPGSAADRAGLKNGDEILKPVPQDDLQGRQDGVLTLALRRDGREFELSYRPRGESVNAWQWERVRGVPDEACVR